MATRLDAELTEKVTATRRRLDVGPGRETAPGWTDPGRPPEDGATVLFATRVPVTLRFRVHEAAKAAGAASLQAWVNTVLSAAADEALTPEGRMGRILQEETRRLLDRALTEGTYGQVSAALEDPELG